MQDYDDTAAYFGLGRGHWEASAAPASCTVLDRGIAQLEKNRSLLAYCSTLFTALLSSEKSDWLPLSEALT